MHSNYIYQEYTPRALILCNCRKLCNFFLSLYSRVHTRHVESFAPLSLNFSPDLNLSSYLKDSDTIVDFTQVPVGVLTVTNEDSGQVQIPCTRTHLALVSYWKVMTSWIESYAQAICLICKPTRSSSRLNS